MGAMSGAPTGAMALSTHSATTSTPNASGELVATAGRGAAEHVVSGGFNISPRLNASDGIVVSRAVNGNS
jgi:hypothetical protein